MPSGQRDTSDREYKHNLQDWIFDCLHLLESVKFGFLTFGPLCNASESNAFTLARCDIAHSINNDNIPYTSDFGTLFQSGCNLLKKVKSEKTPRLVEEHITAIINLKAFIDNKDQHEKSLLQILFDKDKKHSEADISVTLAEHLFKWLAPEKSYVIDKGARGKNPCKCDFDTSICEKTPHFAETGIGPNDAWHGFIDIVLLSQDANAEDSSRWGNIIEVKSSLSRSKFAVMNQAIAQTIVFSFLHKATNPDIFIPNILISPKEFRIIMYNAEHDLLICSQPLNLFIKPDSSEGLKISTNGILILWMVLHYKTFLPDAKQVVNRDFIRIVKAKFPSTAYYADIPFSVKKFPPSKDKKYFPDLESLAKGKDVSCYPLAEQLAGMQLESERNVSESETKPQSGKIKKEK